MKILFATNIDAYRTNCFPEKLTMVPRVGDHVVVSQVFLEYYSKLKLPLRLKVIDVSWTESGVVCQLDYNKQDLEIAINNGAKPYGE